MTDEQLKRWLDRLPPDPAAAPAQQSLWTRAAKSVANLPLNVAQGFTQSVVNLGEMGNPEGPTSQVNIPNFFDVEPPTSTGAGILDMVAGKGGFADIVGQSLIPAGIVGRLGKAAGIAEGPGLEAAKWAAGFAGPELQREDASAGDVAVASALGAGQGGMSFLPRKARILPAAALAAMHGLYETERHDATTGIIAGAADFVGGMLPGHMTKGIKEPLFTPRDTGEFHGPVIDGLDNPQNVEQHILYKQQLATLQTEQAARAADEAADMAAGRGSLKTGVPLLGGTTPDTVPYSDILNSYEASLPPRDTAAGIAARRQFATSQIEPPPVQGELLQPPNILTGLETPELQPHLMADISTPTGRDWLSRGILDLNEAAPPLELGGVPSNPNPIFPVESFGGGPRTAEDMAAMQKAAKAKRVRKPKAPKVQEAEPVVEPVPPAPEPASLPFEPQSRVASVSKGGKKTHGTFEGMDEHGQALVRFDGDTQTTKVQLKKLVKGEAPVAEPDPLATLQKLRQKKIEFTDDDRSALQKFLDSNEDIPDVPDDVPDSIKGQDFSWDLRNGPRPSTGERLQDRPTSLPKPAIQAVDKIVEAVKNAVSDKLKISFKSGEHFSPGSPATSKFTGDISINTDKVIEHLDNWHKMDTPAKGKALANISRWVAHETGHTILSFMDAKNPRVMGKLMAEFEALGPKGRLALVKDFHEQIGYDDAFASLYASGIESALAGAYDIHPQNTKALAKIGLQEFFAEMSAAHIFGKLKEDLLPPEMKSLWQKFKDMMRGVVERLFKSDDLEDIDNELAHSNFKQILGDLHERFGRLTESEYRTLSQESNTKNTALWERFKKQDESLKRKQDIADYEAAVKRLQEEEREAAQVGTKWGPIRENKPEWNSDTERYEWPDGTAAEWATKQGIATLQNAPAAGMRSKIVGNRGFIEAEMLRHLGYGIAGAVAGGVAGPQLSDGQMTVAEGIFAGGILGLAGPVVLKRMLMTMPKANSSTFHHMPAKEAFKRLFTMNNLRDLGGDAANGMGSAPAQFVRWMERNLNLHLPPQLFNAVVQSEGPASYAVQIAHDSFLKSRNFKTNTVIDKAAKDYLLSKIDVPTLRSILGNAPEAQEFANFLVTGRESMGLLQGMLASGLREGSFKNKVIASLQKGDYLTRMYRMFHDPDYKPTQTQIEALAMELTHSDPAYDMSNARIQVEDYLHQIAVERGMFSGGKGDVGQKLDAALFAKRNDRLSAAFRDALGEYTDPKEQIMGTIRHLYINAVSGKFYDQVANMTDDIGLKMSYGREEHTAAIDNLKARILRPHPGDEIATLQKQLKNLEYYVPLDSNIRYGKLGGKLVNRFVRDQLASFDSPWGLMDGSIMRSLASFHNYVKIGRTALNPITVVRNIVAAPVLMGLSKSNPIHALPGGEAWKAMKNMTSGLGREMLEQGIYGVDQVRGEFYRSTEQLMMGDFDGHGLEGMFKSGLNKVLEFYRAPDMLVRGATYVSAKERFAGEFKLPKSDPRVINAARDWTNRYTVNYANVSPLVRSLRQIPFTNLFISFTAEITRIAKNLAEDVFTHPDMGQRVFAGGALTALAGIPILLEKASVAQLSPKDQEEWKKSQSQMPEYSRSRVRIVLGKEDNRFRYLDITSLLQIDSLLQMFRSAGAGDWKGFAAVNPVFGWDNTPVLNIVAEQISGKDLRTGRPVDTPVRRVQEVLKEVVPPLAPGGYEWQRATEALSQTETGERGQTNMRTGRRTTPGELVTNYLTGMRLTTVDTSFLHRNVVSSAKQRIANEASYFRDIAQTNLPVATKQKAADRYKKAVADILQDMHAQLEGQLP